MVGLVMTALKLKQNWDDQCEFLCRTTNDATDFLSSSDKAVSLEDEGRVALTSPSPYRDEAADDEARIGLLDTDIPATRPKRKRSGCCVCCGIK
jgi:hypothetical protein